MAVASAETDADTDIMALALTAGELADIRSDINELLPDTCTIRQVAYANDTLGQPARTFSDRATSVPCRIDPVKSLSLTGEERVSSMKNYIITEGQFLLTLKNGQAIQETDRVIINSVTYEVVKVDDNQSWKASVRCVLNSVEH